MVGSILTGLLTACGGGGDGGTTGGTNPPPATPTIAISTSSTTLNVTQGATASIPVTLTRSGGFTGAVTITVEGLSTGVTASALTISEGQTSGTVTLTAASTATVGTASLTVRATGSGVSSVTASVALTVGASAPAPGSFTLSVSPGTVSLAQSGSSSVTVTIARTGSFTGAVALAVSGAPTGVTATINPTSVTGSTATISLAATASATTGSATLTITGSGTGVSNATTTVALSVTATTPPSSGNVTWKFCGNSGLPVWVAVQDGTTAAWTRVTGTSNSYSFDINAGKGGVAYVVPMSGGGFDLEVFYGATADLQAQGTGLCFGDVGAGKTVTSTVAGAGLTDLVLPTLGHSVGTNLSGNVTFQNVLTGTVDLVASRAAVGLAGTTVTYTINKLVIRRGLNPAANSVLPVIDFGASDAITPVTRNITIGNLGTDQSILTGAYITANNTVAAYLTDISGSNAATRTYPGIPSANQVTGDLHLIDVIALQNPQAVLNNTRQAGVIFKDAADKTVTLGPSLSSATLSVLSSAPYARLRSVWAFQTEYGKLFGADYQQPSSGANTRRTQIQQTSGYQAPTSITLDVPDFTSVAGFDPTWGLRAGAAVTYTITSTGWTGSGTAAAPYVEGTSFLAATRMGTITP